MNKLFAFGSEVDVDDETDVIDETTAQPRAPRPIDIEGLEHEFLEYCIQRGWIVSEQEETGRRHYLTEEGRRELVRFGLRSFT